VLIAAEAVQQDEAERMRNILAAANDAKEANACAAL
jgi:hypothetical protein